MHRERAACNEHMEGEGRGYEVQLTAVMAVCVFPRTGLLPAVCHALAGVSGSCSAAAHHELCGLWVLLSCSAVPCSSMPESVFGGPPPQELHRPGVSTVHNTGFTVTKNV